VIHVGTSEYTTPFSNVLDVAGVTNVTSYVPLALRGPVTRKSESFSAEIDVAGVPSTRTEVTSLIPTPSIVQYTPDTLLSSAVCVRAFHDASVYAATLNINDTTNCRINERRVSCASSSVARTSKENSVDESTDVIFPLNWPVFASRLVSTGNGVMFAYVTFESDTACRFREKLCPSDTVPRLLEVIHVTLSEYVIALGNVAVTLSPRMTVMAYVPLGRAGTRHRNTVDDTNVVLDAFTLPT
jgi:hypothetical protein